MFESKAAMFLYAVSPVHAGAGTALGAIDNPIQRERHTGHPVIAGSGVKGALRHEAQARGQKVGELGVEVVFGPASNSSDHAGSLSISDAQLVLFPVRSLKQSFVYATCPTALGRLARLLDLAGVAPGWMAPSVASPDDALCANPEDLVTRRRENNADVSQVVLEVFAFKPSLSPEAAKAAEWLSEHAFPGGEATRYFRDKLKKHLVVLHDDRFNYFVKYATVVEPHVRINDDTGTADGGGLFYTENLPPESLLVSLAMASKSRKKDAEHTASAIMTATKAAFGERLVQVGGDATVGRGQMLVRFVGEG